MYTIRGECLTTVLLEGNTWKTCCGLACSAAGELITFDAWHNRFMLLGPDGACAALTPVWYPGHACNRNLVAMPDGGLAVSAFGSRPSIILLRP